MENKVQLITYVDRLGGGNIADLGRLLSVSLKNVFGGVHLLPFFRYIDGADAGFDPIDHTQVDPRLGDWSDVKTLSTQLGVMADVIVNHVSDQSPQFLDYSEHGRESAFHGLFLRRDLIFPGAVNEASIAAIYRPRPGKPFIDLTLQNGEAVTLWCTFTPHQIDIDVQHELGKAYLEKVLETLAAAGVTMVRLDAIGYAVKKQGTSCFMIAETFDFISQLAKRARALGIEVLVEVHSYYERQIEIARHVDWVYDFALPPLVLHAFAFGTAEYLKHWIGIRPSNAITVLDTHDGIGIIDIGADPQDRARRPGLVPPEDVDSLVEHIHASSNGESLRATGAAASNLDLYQVNCTFFDAMGRDERRYLLARAIQFFLPGIPQVYYVGLLAGCNDMKLLERSGVGRDINRHYYDLGSIAEELRRAVVSDLLELIRLRNTHSAFSGTFAMLETGCRVLALRWQKDADWAMLTVNLATAEHELVCSSPTGSKVFEFHSGAARPSALRP